MFANHHLLKLLLIGHLVETQQKITEYILICSEYNFLKYPIVETHCDVALEKPDAAVSILTNVNNADRNSRAALLKSEMHHSMFFLVCNIDIFR